jgi:hypothetical protein
MDISNQFIVIIVTLPILGGGLFWYVGILEKRFPEFHLDFLRYLGDFWDYQFTFHFFFFFRIYP